MYVYDGATAIKNSKQTLTRDIASYTDFPDYITSNC